MSGSGKTQLRQSHEKLYNLPCIDIEAFYRAAEQQGYSLHWRDALRQFLAAVDRTISQTPEGDDIVVEAFLKPGGDQRAGLEEIAARWREPVTYIWCHAPRQECRRRVQYDNRGGWQRLNARLDLIDSVAEQHFRPVPGESAEDVFCPMPRMGILRCMTATVVRDTHTCRAVDGTACANGFATDGAECVWGPGQPCQQFNLRVQGPFSDLLPVATIVRHTVGL